jgi:hypothetical protein
MDSKKAEKRRNKKVRKKNKRVYKLLFIFGLLLLFLQYLLFKKTSIDINIIISLIFFSGLVGLYYDLKKYSFTYKIDGYLSYFLSFLQSAVTLGGIVGLVFLSMIFFLADGIATKKEYKIIKRHSVSGRKFQRNERKPVFTIQFNNKEKDIKYSNTYFNEMDKFKSIIIESQEGFFGFEIIKKKTLNK